MVFKVTLRNNSNMTSVIPLICFYCQARSEKIMLLCTDKTSVFYFHKIPFVLFSPMKVPVLWVLKRHLVSHRILFDMPHVLGIYRLKALEKIHSTCNFKFKVQVNGGERENIWRSTSHQPANKRRQMHSLMIIESGFRLWRIRNIYVKKYELLNWVSGSCPYNFIFCVHI